MNVRTPRSLDVGVCQRKQAMAEFMANTSRTYPEKKKNGCGLHNLKMLDVTNCNSHQYLSIFIKLIVKKLEIPNCDLKIRIPCNYRSNPKKSISLKAPVLPYLLRACMLHPFENPQMKVF